MSLLLLKVHVVATLLMTGVIWMVQWVHYPLLADVGPQEFATYHDRHSSRITMLVGPLMVVELATGAWLAMSGLFDPVVGWGLLALIGVIWGSTAIVQVPQHGRLAGGLREAAVSALVRGNWIRTVAWSVRAVVLVAVAPLVS